MGAQLAKIENKEQNFHLGQLMTDDKIFWTGGKFVDFDFIWEAGFRSKVVPPPPGGTTRWYPLWQIKPDFMGFLQFFFDKSIVFSRLAYILDMKTALDAVFGP